MAEDIENAGQIASIDVAEQTVVGDEPAAVVLAENVGLATREAHDAIADESRLIQQHVGVEESDSGMGQIDLLPVAVLLGPEVAAPGFVQGGQGLVL